MMETLRSSVCIGNHIDPDTQEPRAYRSSLITDDDGHGSFSWTWLDSGHVLDLELTPETPFLIVWERIMSLAQAR